MKAQTRPNPLLYVACYSIWIALCAATIILLFQSRIVIVDIAYLLGATELVGAFIDKIVLLPLALAAAAIILSLEHVLRVSVQHGRLWQRAGKAAFILLMAVVISYILHFAIIAFRLGTV
jgi:hypothetical protein